MFLLAGFMCPGNVAVRDKADAAIDMPDALGNLGSRIQQSDASQPGKPLDQEIVEAGSQDLGNIVRTSPKPVSKHLFQKSVLGVSLPGICLFFVQKRQE